MIEFKKIKPGRFSVINNGQNTKYEIVNGSLGQSGKESNMYGIFNKDTGKISWIGSLQKAKKSITFTLEK